MIVLDCSVILKWFFVGEPERDKALEFREKHVNGQEIIGGPDLLPYEIANCLATKSAVSEQDALKGIVEILSYEIDVHHFEAEDFMHVIRLARVHHISAYDAAYVHLAQKVDCTLITADQKLYERTKSLGFVKIL